MKRLLTILFSGVTLFALSGCGVEPTIIDECSTEDDQTRYEEEYEFPSDEIFEYSFEEKVVDVSNITLSLHIDGASTIITSYDADDETILPAYGLLLDIRDTSVRGLEIFFYEDMPSNTFEYFMPYTQGDYQIYKTKDVIVEVDTIPEDDTILLGAIYFGDTIIFDEDTSEDDIQSLINDGEPIITINATYTIIK